MWKMHCLKVLVKFAVKVWLKWRVYIMLRSKRVKTLKGYLNKPDLMRAVPVFLGIIILSFSVT